MQVSKNKLSNFVVCINNKDYPASFVCRQSFPYARVDLI